MKVITYIITIAFVISSLALYIITQMSYSREKNYAFKLNGTKISQNAVARNKFMFSRGNGAKASEEVYEVLAINKTIEDELTQELADNLKIKVSNKEINEEMSKIEKSVKDKEQFKRMLRAQGYTKATLKKELAKNIRAMKLIESLVENAKVSEEEILEVYDGNKEVLFQGKALEDVREEIKESLAKQKGNEKYLEELNTLKEKMKLEDIREIFKEKLEKEKLEKEGVKFTNIEYNEILLNFINSGLKEEDAKIKAESFLESQAKLINLAKEYNVEINNKLPLDLKVRKAYGEVFEKIKEDVTYTEKELKDFFETNIDKYNEYPSADAYISEIRPKPSLLDEAKAKSKAEEILKEVTVENFAKIAKEKSQGPTASRGGDLGTFSRDSMVKEFSDAVFKGKVGEIYPEVVKTIFGYHIIYIQERDEKANTARASHIIIRKETSEETIEENLKLAKEEAGRISSGDIKFEDLPKDKYTSTSLYKNITKEGYIPNLGFEEELAKEIYKSPLNKVAYKKLGEKIYLFKKIKETPFKKADYNQVKPRVREDYKAQKAIETLKEKL